MPRLRTLLCAAAFAATASAGQAAVLYTNDFDSAAVFGAGVTGAFGPHTTDTATAGAWNAAGWVGTVATNTTTGNPAAFTTLSLAGLAAHTQISASFILGFLESWDSYDGTVTPDNLEIWIDGVQFANLTANNASGSVEDYDGFTEIADGAQVNAGNFFFSDTLLDVGFTFAHSAPTLTLGIRASGAGWQGGADESWGIDNIQLTYNAGSSGPIPEPGTWALMIAGFGLAGATLRRRRAAIA